MYKILLVDDEPLLLQGLRRTLKKRFDIETASSGREALGRISANNSYAVVVSDYSMPGMNGLELLSKVARIAPNTARIVLTGTADVSIAAQAVNSGDVFQFHLKPCSSEVLNQAIDAGIKLFQKRRRKISLRRELAEAGEVQRNLIPEVPTAIDGCEVAAECLWVEEIGGDYYDLLQPDPARNDRVCAIVGDVSGHGLAAALLMASIRAFFRESLARFREPAEVVSYVNQHMVRDVRDSGQFVTLFCCEIDAGQKMLRWVRAGHAPAIMYDARSDSFTELGGDGISLGVSADSVYRQQSCSFGPGQVVLLGTDGVWEAFNAAGEMFGRERLKHFVRLHHKAPVSKLLSAITQEWTRFCGVVPPGDDATLLIFKAC
jgi:sigma-B regulation protein RsbU (phosphoserine phosphatase)